MNASSLPALSRAVTVSVNLPRGVELAVDPDFVLAIVSQAQTAEQLEGGDAEGETAEATEAPAEG